MVKYEFAVTNTGDALLEIRDVKTTCGCFYAGKWTRKVEPGQTGTIPLELATRNLSGPVAKYVEVLCNATNQPPISLQFTGTVWWPIEINPLAITMSVLSGASTNGSAKVKIINHEPEPLTLSEPASGNAHITAELKTVRPGREFELSARLVPPIGSGNVFGDVTLKTSSKKMPSLTVPVYAVLQPEVIVLPAQINLPAVLATNQLKQTISVRSFWSEKLEISDVSFNAKGVKMDLHELQPGKFYSFTLQFPPGYEMEPGEKIALKLRTNHPHFPSLEIPITQRHRPAAATNAPKADTPVLRQ